MVKAGCRVSAKGEDVPPSSGAAVPSRRYGFAVRAAAAKSAWAVRFDDGETATVVSAKLKVEHTGPTFADVHAVDELHAPRHLPLPAHRRELVFAFDGAAFDFRAWFVEAILRPAAAEDSALRAGLAPGVDALALPPGVAAPMRKACSAPVVRCRTGGSEGGSGGDAGGSILDETSDRLLSNLHRMAGVAQLASGGKQRANRTPWHTAYARTLRAETKPGKRCNAAQRLPARRATFEALLRRFVREVVAPLLNCGADDVMYQAAPTLRVSYPSERPCGHPHCDYEYGHQPAEVSVCGCCAAALVRCCRPLFVRSPALTCRWRWSGLR